MHSMLPEYEAGFIPWEKGCWPTAFYLPDPVLRKTADAVVVLPDSLELPVHSQVLSMQSKVLRKLFLDQEDLTKASAGLRHAVAVIL